MPSERPPSLPLPSVYRFLRSRRLHLSLGAFVLVAAVFCGFDATRTRPSDGTVWLLGRPSLEVLDILQRPTGAPTPLRIGDEIEGIANRIVESSQDAAGILRLQKPGSSVPYLVQRGQEHLQLMVPLTSTRVDLQDYLVNVLLALVYLGIGFGVYLRSGNERPAALFFMLCLAFCLYFVTNLNQVSYYLGALITQNIGAFARFLLPAVFLHFFLIFPSRKLVLVRHRYLTALLYVLPVALYLRFTLDQFVGTQGAHIHPVIWMILGLYYVFGLGALLHGYFSYRDPMMRQRVRILTFGTLAAVIPFLILKIGLEELAYRPALSRMGVIPLAAIPISFGYCVARYQVLQIDLLLKKSLSYALLTAVVWLGYLGGAWWLGSKVLAFLPGSSPLVAAGTTLAVAAALWPLRRRLQGRLDHGFYHARDNMTSLIEEFTRDIPRLLNREEMMAKVGARLCDVLQLPGLVVYLTADGDQAVDFRLVKSIDGESGPIHRPLDHSQAIIPLVHPAPQPPAAKMTLEKLGPRLARLEEPFFVDPERDPEQKLLAESGLQLLIPLTTQERLIGLIGLPPMPGGAEYEVHAVQLLTIVAGQVALQVENSRLYEEEVAKQKLEEEMAMARKIQARLLPRQIPVLQNVQIDAVNISSKQVSGDYYDIIEREDGKVALIIADVSGKGMPASILASNLQAALRAQCDHCESPAKVLGRINKQIYASTDPAHFATLFLALFDPENQRLLYSSGGHNPPVVMRAAGSLELLEAGGLPLGAFDFGTYQEDEVQLRQGDLVFFYTDGVTETKGPDGDEDFGEERLNDLLLNHRHRDVGDLFSQVRDQLLSFSGTPVADDDITMIGLKIADRGQAALAESTGS